MNHDWSFFIPISKIFNAKALRRKDAKSLIFESQVLTYLCLTNKCLGMVINFGERRVVDEIH